MSLDDQNTFQRSNTINLLIWLAYSEHSWFQRIVFSRRTERSNRQSNISFTKHVVVFCYFPFRLEEENRIGNYLRNKKQLKTVKNRNVQTKWRNEKRKSRKTNEVNEH